jgi:leucyl aminopeptidase
MPARGPMVNVSVTTPQQSKAEAYIVGVDKDRKATGLAVLGLEKDAVIKRILKDKAVSLGFKSARSVPTARGWVVLVGMGDVKKLTPEKIGTLANIGCRAAAGLGAKRAATTLVLDLHDAKAAQAIVHGAVIGALDFDQYKSKKDEDSVQLKELLLISDGPGTAIRRLVKDAMVVARAVNDARLLANTPANTATPKWLAAEARKRGTKHGFKVTVKGRTALRRDGYNALCGVGQGSENEEQLITMEYAPKGWKKTIVVVGKGVCFDSGGISLKPGQGMWDMKYDKCGACNTIALMTTLKALGVPDRVIGIVPAVENMPSGSAQRPGDIVVAKDGTTIEVLNTDAEGRLILADALAHGRTFKPDWMCDMATLTGAVDIAVGPTFVGIMGSDDALVASFVDASRRIGDKGWHTRAPTRTSRTSA